MKSIRKMFCLSWLALGAIQIAATGCGGAANAATGDDQVLSSEPEAKASADEAAAQASRVPANDRPIRISRTFLSSSLQASVDSNRYSVEWKEEATQIPAPTRDDVVADFRDFQGCAWLSSSESARLCFNVMPDVSSVGVNSKDMKLEGADALLKQQCSTGATNVHYVSAARNGADEKSYDIHFAAQCAQNEIQFTLHLERM